MDRKKWMSLMTVPMVLGVILGASPSWSKNRERGHHSNFFSSALHAKNERKPVTNSATPSPRTLLPPPATLQIQEDGCLVKVITLRNGNTVKVRKGCYRPLKLPRKLPQSVKN